MPMVMIRPVMTALMSVARVVVPRLVPMDFQFRLAGCGPGPADDNAPTSQHAVIMWLVRQVHLVEQRALCHRRHQSVRKIGTCIK